MRISFGSVTFQFKRAFFVLIIFWLSSCGNSKTYKTVATCAPIGDLCFITEKQVIILPTLVNYESIENESIMKLNQYNSAQDISYIDKNIRYSLMQKGFEIFFIDNFPQNNIKDKLKEINFFSKDLFHNEISSDLKDKIVNIGSLFPNSTIMVIKLHVKVGSEGVWNAYSGRLTSSNSYTLMSSVLWETQNGTKLWDNKVQFRDLPKINDSDYDKAIFMLVQNLSAK